MEKNKKTNTLLYIYIIFGLGLLLVSSSIANIYFYFRSQSRIFDCNLGERIEIEFDEQDNILLANIVYPSNIVSGTKYNQKILLKTNEIASSYFVRAKALYADYNIVNESVNVEVSPEDSWQLSTDNYYYLNTPILSWQEVSFIDTLTLPIIYTEVKNNTIITIVIEFLNTSADVESLWNVDRNIFQNTTT